MLSSITVKVGKTSTVKFSNCIVHRAVSMEELTSIVNYDNDCHIVVFEHIFSDEEENARNFINEFVAKDTNNKVLFYIPTNDETTSGLADEFEADIYMTLEELYRAIRNSFNMNVSTFLQDKGLADEYIPDGITDIFGQASTNSEEEKFEVEEKSNDSDNSTDGTDDNIKETQLPVVSLAKVEDVAETNTDVAEVKVDVEAPAEEENHEEPEEVTTVEEEVVNDNNTNTVEAEGTAEQVSDMTDESTKETVDVPVSEVVEAPTVEDNSTESDVKVPTVSLDKPAIEENNIKNNSDNTDYDKVIQALMDEIAELKERYNNIVADDEVIEISQQSDNNSAEVEELKKSVEDLMSTIKSNEEAIKGLESELESATQQTESLKKLLDDSKDSADIIENLNDEIKGITGEKKKVEDELSEALKNYEESKEYCADVEAHLENEKKYRYSTIGIFKEILETIIVNMDEIEKGQTEYDEVCKELNRLRTEINDTSSMYNNQTSELSDVRQKSKELEEELSAMNEENAELINKVQKLTDELTEKSTSLAGKNTEVADIKTKMTELSKKLQDKTSENYRLMNEGREKDNQLENIKSENEALEKRAELADQYADQESKRLQGEIDIAVAKIKLLEEEIRGKDEKIKELNDSSTKAAELISDSVEYSNEELKAKFSVLTKQVDELKEERDKAQKECNEAQSECRGYQNIIKSISGDNGVYSSISGKYRVQPINYTGLAHIITFTGTGSHGKTTAAMSLAQKLGTSNQVLFMDLDMVNAVADAWFGKSPICRDIPNVANDLSATSFNIFINKGMATISAYVDRLLIPYVRKNGFGIDYFSGVYGAFDESKLAAADLSTLLNMLSTRYSYIIMDLGRLGNSEVNDSLIKELTQVAYKNIFVTNNDRFDARNFNIKAKKAELRMDNSAWLFNMSIEPMINPKTLAYTGNIPYGMIPFDGQLVGNREVLLKNRVSKDSFEKFLNTAVFGRK